MTATDTTIELFIAVRSIVDIAIFTSNPLIARDFSTLLVRLNFAVRSHSKQFPIVLFCSFVDRYRFRSRSSRRSFSKRVYMYTMKTGVSGTGHRVVCHWKRISLHTLTRRIIITHYYDYMCTERRKKSASTRRWNVFFFLAISRHEYNELHSTSMCWAPRALALTESPPFPHSHSIT